MSLQEFKSRILPMKDKLFRLSLSLTGDSAEAEDIVQEAMIRIWDRRDSWAEISNLEGYCMRMVRNRSIDWTREARRRTRGLEGQETLISRDLSAQQSLEQKEMRTRVSGCVETLPEKQQTILRLRDIEGMTYQGIADTLDITLDQVRISLYRARNAIKQELLKLESYGLQ